ncbi:MAG TPA: hypothetical protein DEO65_10440 [Bacillus bacterium]|uniref:Potassium transporter TrkA n=1 Tax=Siminovitchia fordii TaxID=254759 RepID=A0ABQ4K0D6_9BACI|nr:TrkA C-terminal domain-containing protein [Siminovitchia fordii]GIN19106.1 potassium transporter TrkA [Siminovitchia fordii]HBZ10279.1 hypothetical protein [Bacillus sp. (in: firmicutes)]
MELLLMLGYFIFVAVIIEISSTLLVITGLKRKVARYQVISMLTNTGFTTDEARLILEHPVRRKISGFLILFGAFSLAVIISILSSYLSDDIHFKQLGLILCIVGITLCLLKTGPIRRFLKEKLNDSLQDQYQLDELPIREALYMNKSDLLIDIPLSEESHYVNKRWIDVWDDDEDIKLLFIRRGEEVIRLHLDEEQLHEGDLLFVLGDEKTIKYKFRNELHRKEKNNHGISGS